MKINNGDELLERFAKKLVEDKGEVFENDVARQNKINKIIDDVTALIQEEIVRELPDDRLKVLDELLEKDEDISENKLNAIILGAGLNYGKIVEKVVLRYRKTYLGEEA